MSNIPKKIHYCWVGGNPKPQSVLYCIDSWKRFCPDYEIIEWNETNYDFTKNEYMRQAYEAKKWGFVPDYARLDIIYEHGGIYLDTDVEMVRSFDELLENQSFFGFEDTGDGEYFVNCGHGFGAVACHQTIKAARDMYDHVSFIKSDGELNLIASPYYTTKSLKQIGLIQKDCDQSLPDVKIYASDVLCPKNFRTGKIKKTSRTVSIHHFSASWVDEKIKKEMEYQQKIINRYGKQIAGYIFLMESVLQKYSIKELFTKLPMRILKKLKYKLIAVKDNAPYYIGLAKVKFTQKGTDGATLLDTSLDSDNSGDGIIMESCIHQLSHCMDTGEMKHFPTHRNLSDDEKSILTKSKMKILCGTNILSGHMRTYGLWKLTPDVYPYKNTVLMGVGFDSKDKSYDSYTKMFFRQILSPDKIHSVRDSFAEQKLKDMGIDNVLNTGCPTMWGLTPEKCASIPVQKANNVVCTLTDYNQDKENDKAMLDILLKNYKKVYLWLQGKEDLEYVQKLGYDKRVTLIDSAISSYDAVLAESDLDYVGTRLHAGIRALNKGHRSLIISIDNRAECIHADTGLPVVPREDIRPLLECRLNGTIETAINMPWENIEKWKNNLKVTRYEYKI